MSYKGFFRPNNPTKYKGDPTQIIFRSKWELKMMLHFDMHQDVIEWSSEEIRIPYRSKIDNRRHTYYPDFFVRYKDKNGKTETEIIEVKPHAQTQAPKVKAKSKKSIREVVTYGTNISKWEAAEAYCKDRNWRFRILTENEIYGPGGSGG